MPSWRSVWQNPQSFWTTSDMVRLPLCSDLRTGENPAHRSGASKLPPAKRIVVFQWLLARVAPGDVSFAEVPQPLAWLVPPLFGSSVQTGNHSHDVAEARGAAHHFNFVVRCATTQMLPCQRPNFADSFFADVASVPVFPAGRQ